MAQEAEEAAQQEMDTTQNPEDQNVEGCVLFKSNIYIGKILQWTS